MEKIPLRLEKSWRRFKQEKPEDRTYCLCLTSTVPMPIFCFFADNGFYQSSVEFDGENALHTLELVEKKIEYWTSNLGISGDFPSARYSAEK